MAHGYSADYQAGNEAIQGLKTREHSQFLKLQLWQKEVEQLSLWTQEVPESFPYFQEIGSLCQVAGATHTHFRRLIQSFQETLSSSSDDDDDILLLEDRQRQAGEAYFKANALLDQLQVEITRFKMDFRPFESTSGLNTGGPHLVSIFNLVDQGNLELLKKLRAQKHPLDLINTDGTTLLQCAIIADHPNLEVIKLVLDACPAMIRWKGLHGHTPLHDAVSHDLPEVVDLLLEKGANVDAISQAGSTPLLIAARSGVSEYAAKLLAYGANIEDGGDKYHSPLFTAVAYNNVNLVKYLCKMGADVNTVTADFNTPLHEACHQANHEVIRTLLDHGALPNALDRCNMTPMEVAAEARDGKCHAILSKYDDCPRWTSKSLDSLEYHQVPVFGSRAATTSSFYL